MEVKTDIRSLPAMIPTVYSCDRLIKTWKFITNYIELFYRMRTVYWNSYSSIPENGISLGGCWEYDAFVVRLTITFSSSYKIISVTICPLIVDLLNHRSWTSSYMWMLKKYIFCRKAVFSEKKASFQEFCIYFA